MNRHDTDAMSLAFGLVFAFAVGWWLLWQWLNTAAPGPGWFVAVALLLLGAFGLLTAVVPRRRSTAADAEGAPVHRH